MPLDQSPQINFNIVTLFFRILRDVFPLCFRRFCCAHPRTHDIPTAFGLLCVRDKPAKSLIWPPAGARIVSEAEDLNSAPAPTLRCDFYFSNFICFHHHHHHHGRHLRRRRYHCVYVQILKNFLPAGSEKGRKKVNLNKIFIMSLWSEFKLRFRKIPTK